MDNPGWVSLIDSIILVSRTTLRGVAGDWRTRMTIKKSICFVVPRKTLLLLKDCTSLSATYEKRKECQSM